MSSATAALAGPVPLSRVWAKGTVVAEDLTGEDLSDVLQLHTNLMNSSGHRANILRSDWKEIGLAFDLGEHNGRPAIFLTEVFGLPTSTEFAEKDIWA